MRPLQALDEAHEHRRDAAAPAHGGDDGPGRLVRALHIARVLQTVQQRVAKRGSQPARAAPQVQSSTFGLLKWAKCGFLPTFQAHICKGGGSTHVLTCAEAGEAAAAGASVASMVSVPKARATHPVGRVSTIVQVLESCTDPARLEGLTPSFAGVLRSGALRRYCSDPAAPPPRPRVVPRGAARPSAKRDAYLPKHRVVSSAYNTARAVSRRPLVTA